MKCFGFRSSLFRGFVRRFLYAKNERLRVGGREQVGKNCSSKSARKDLGHVEDHFLHPLSPFSSSAAPDLARTQEEESYADRKKVEKNGHTTIA